MATSEGIGTVCRELGLSDDVASTLCQKLLTPGHEINSAPIAPDVAAMKRREAELMQLLHAKSPEHIVHNLRNVLNELSLLQAAADLG